MPTRQEQTGLICPRCKHHRLFIRTVTETNHVLHALLTLLLCCAWLPVWFALACYEGTSEWRCTSCGFGFAPPRQGKLAARERPKAIAKAGRANCGKCGSEALSGTELGETVYTCPACGRLS
jgi:DNA-directed RNA polymerase subunit RPC12/RpoP